MSCKSSLQGQVNQQRKAFWYNLLYQHFFGILETEKQLNDFCKKMSVECVTWKGEHMAHFEHFTRGDCTSITQHVERKKDKQGNYLKYKNGQIDTSRTHLNYNLAPERQQLNFIKERTEELKTLKRKDVNVLCSWIVTAPKTLPEQYNREFFEQTYKHLVDMYGENNVVSAYVHMDETTPHIHFCFVPVVHDSKKNCDKVSCKECVTQLDLKKFHPQLQKSIDTWKNEKGYDFECDIMNGATANGNMTVQELKNRSLTAENEKLSNNNEWLKKNSAELVEEINDLVERSETAQDRLNEIQGINNRLNTENAVLERSVASKQHELDLLTPKLLKAKEVKEIKADKNIFGKPINKITYDYNYALSLIETAKKNEDVEKHEKELLEREKRLQEQEKAIIKRENSVADKEKRLNDLINNKEKIIKNTAKQMYNTAIKNRSSKGIEDYLKQHYPNVLEKYKTKDIRECMEIAEQINSMNVNDFYFDI